MKLETLSEKPCASCTPARSRREAISEAECQRGWPPSRYTAAAADSRTRTASASRDTRSVRPEELRQSMLANASGSSTTSDGPVSASAIEAIQLRYPEAAAAPP